MTDQNKDFNVDSLLNSLFKPTPPKESLRELFDRRVQELKITSTTALEILKLESRTLNGILTGTQKRVDYTNIIKIATFLQVPKEMVAQMYLESLEKNFSSELMSSPDKVEFIKNNFDLITFRNAHFIDSITDFEQIEKQIISFLGLKSIFDYKKPPMDVAFSAGLVKPKNELTRSFWINSAMNYFQEVDNQYEYDREALLKYFPQIRWHSTNVELGLRNIMRDLYRMGITIFFQSPLPSLKLRGATFSVNGKPCIVLTNLSGFYPTLWFALVHELFHVIFDWEEIKQNRYHLSDEDSEQLSVIEKEKEADNFARQYLFSKEKTDAIRPHLKNESYINEFTQINHVHPSFAYLFHAHDSGSTDRMAWARAKRYNPDLSPLIAPLENDWKNPLPIAEFAKKIEHKLYK